MADMEFQFDEPDFFMIDDVRYDILPLPTDMMKLCLLFMELSQKVDKSKNAKSKSKSPKKALQKEENFDMEGNKVVFDEMAPLAEKIVNAGVARNDDPDKPANLPRKAKSVIKLIQIAALVVKATTGSDPGVDKDFLKSR